MDDKTLPLPGDGGGYWIFHSSWMEPLSTPPATLDYLVSSGMTAKTSMTLEEGLTQELLTEFCRLQVTIAGLTGPLALCVRGKDRASAMQEALRQAKYHLHEQQEAIHRRSQPHLLQWLNVQLQEQPVADCSKVIAARPMVSGGPTELSYMVTVTGENGKASTGVLTQEIHSGRLIYVPKGETESFQP